MDEREELENQGFKVKDRRRFNSDGTPIDVAAETSTAPEDPGRSPDFASAPNSASPEAAAGIPANFSSLILSLAAGAQTALGIAPHPVTGKVEKNISQAKYSIDLLGILQEKTKGRLTAEEDQLLEALLYDLRMRYVEVRPS